MMSVALILTSFWLAWFLYRRGGFNSAVFSTAWAVLVVLPVMAMPLNVLVNERRLYLPVAAFCLLLGILLSRWYREYAAAQGRENNSAVVGRCPRPLDDLRTAPIASGRMISPCGGMSSTKRP